jgi:methylated-DNA-[protein]-cysteine S-methyltransferase
MSGPRLGDRPDQSLLYCTTASPLGELLLVGDGERLHRLHMRDGRHAIGIAGDWRRCEAAFTEVLDQLSAYFEGSRTAFEIELALAGTPFQLMVWNALCEIPYGETISYGELARRLGNPAAVRAVGLANGRNPVSLIVPCHRVIGADGSLTGYGGGLANKRWLLDLENRNARGEAQLTLHDLAGRHFAAEGI